jgi:hypothetical protein
MNASVADEFLKHCEGVDAFVQNRKRREPDQGKALLYALELYGMLNTAFDQTSVSKHHLIGLIAFSEGLGTDKESGGVVSPLHLKALNEMAKALAKHVNPQIPKGTEELFAKAVSALLMFSIAITVFGIDHIKKGPEKFRIELFLRYFLGTQGLHLLFKNLIDSIGGDAQKGEMTASLLEVIALSMSLFCLGGNQVNEDIVHGVRAHLLSKMDEALKIVSGMNQPLWTGLLKGLAIAIDRQEYERFSTSSDEILKAIGTSLETLNEDLAEVRKITNIVLDAYQASKENRPNLIHMVG